MERGRYLPIIIGIRSKADAARAATSLGSFLEGNGYSKAYIARVVAHEAAHAFSDPCLMQEGDGMMGVRLDQGGVIRGLYYQPGERTLLEQLSIVSGPAMRGLGLSKSDRKRFHQLLDDGVRRVEVNNHE